MTDQSLSLKNLLLPDETEANGSGWADDAIDDALSKIPLPNAEGFKKTITDAIAEILDIGLADIFVGAWNRYKLLEDYCNREKYGPDEILLVPMGKHTIQSTHKPAINIEISDVSVYRLVFDIDLTLELEGLVLQVRDGKIREISSGNCEGRGTVKWGDKVLIERKTPKIDLPGSITLGDGIEIPAAARA